MELDCRPFLDAGSSASKMEPILQLYACGTPLVPITIPYGKAFSWHHMQDLCTFSDAPFPCCLKWRILEKRVQNLKFVYVSRNIRKSSNSKG